jgi:hypothetical protein
MEAGLSVSTWRQGCWLAHGGRLVGQHMEAGLADKVRKSTGTS